MFPLQGESIGQERLKIFILNSNITENMGVASQQDNLPLITIGVIVFNREWIIKQMLASVLSQTYPHNKIFLVLVDGESKDDTVKVAEEFLALSDLSGYEIIVKDSSIPEARNICVQNMKGDFLFFWDSDVIMEPSAVGDMLEVLKKENADVVASNVTKLFIESIDDIEKKRLEWEKTHPKEPRTKITSKSHMCSTLIAKKVLQEVAFDPDLTYDEDFDFSIHATERGFKILKTFGVIGYDINNLNKPYSDIYFDMPLKRTLRGLRKKGAIEAQSLAGDCPSIIRAVTTFFWSNKRYIFYPLYIPITILTIIGVLIQNLWLSLVLPCYILVYAAIQFRKRGLRRGLKAIMRSIVVGIPTTYMSLYYCMKLSIKKPKGLTTKL